MLDDGAGKAALALHSHAPPWERDGPGHRHLGAYVGELGCAIGLLKTATPRMVHFD